MNSLKFFPSKPTLPLLNAEVTQKEAEADTLIVHNFLLSMSHMAPHTANGAQYQSNMLFFSLLFKQFQSVGEEEYSNLYCVAYLSGSC